MADTTASALLASVPTVITVSIARQPIVDKDRAIFGYELFNRSSTGAQPGATSRGATPDTTLPAALAPGPAVITHTAASDAAMLFNALSHIDNEGLLDKKILFINCTFDALAGGHLDLVHPGRVVLEIPPLEAATGEQIESCADMLREIHQRGFKLAFGHFVLSRQYLPWLPLATYIKFDMIEVKHELLLPLIRYTQSRTSAQVIAEKVETAAQVQMLDELGVKLFQGYWFAKPTLLQGQTIRPAQANIITLINLVRKQASTVEIEDVLKRDATL